MDSSLTEEVPISAEDAELPDMVPVSIRSTLPEFQNYSLERVLAGLLLTWKEFLHLFDIRVEACDYYIRGSNGAKSDLDQKIGDYVSTFRRKLKIYPVTLERVPGIEETSRGQRNSTNSEGSNGSNQGKMSDNNKSSGSATKKLKLMDEDKRKRNHRKMTKESLEKIAQSVMQGQAAKRASAGKKVDGKRDSVKSRSPTPPATTTTTDAKVLLDGPSTSSEAHSSMAPQVAVDPKPSTGKLKRLSTDHSSVKDFAPSASLSPATKRGRKPRKSRTLSSRRSTKESFNTEVSHESQEEETSESDDEETPSKEKRKSLKQNVLKYFSDKVSPRSFLRLRNELMGLRDQEKYFKVTTVVPMTAGMMEQAFCRKLTE